MISAIGKLHFHEQLPLLCATWKDPHINISCYMLGIYPNSEKLLNFAPGRWRWCGTRPSRRAGASCGGRGWRRRRRAPFPPAGTELHRSTPTERDSCAIVGCKMHINNPKISFGQWCTYVRRNILLFCVGELQTTEDATRWSKRIETGTLLHGRTKMSHLSFEKKL